MFILKILTKIKLFLLVLTFTCVAFAQQQILIFENSWIRQMPPGSPTLAAYMTITNTTQTDVIISGVSTTASKLAEIHEVKMENDLMKMREISELIIQPEQTIELKQGSMHLMLIEMANSLEEGDEVEIKFELQGLSPVTTIVPVRKEL